MSMSEYTPRRLKSAKVKADQLTATGAKIVVTSCHNCVDGLTDVIRHYKLDMEVAQLVNLVADALVIEERSLKRYRRFLSRSHCRVTLFRSDDRCGG